MCKVIIISHISRAFSLTLTLSLLYLSWKLCYLFYLFVICFLFLPFYRFYSFPGTWSNWEIVKMINNKYFIGVLLFKSTKYFGLLIWLNQSLIDSRMQPIKPMLCQNIPTELSHLILEGDLWFNGCFAQKYLNNECGKSMRSVYIASQLFI